MSIHVCNGHATLNKLSGLPGQRFVWADALVLGPCPPLWGEQWRRLRLDFLVGDADAQTGAEELWDEDVERLLQGSEEITLWYEHDLYDQLLLSRFFALVARGVAASISLVSIDRHPAHPRFRGLGELTAEELTALFPQRRPIDRRAIALGADAWAAYSASDPRDIEDLLRGDLSVLPFLAPALRRHLEEFPGAQDGLSRSERSILALVGGGVSDAFAAWRQLLDGEDCLYLADDWFRRVLQGLPELKASPALALPLQPGKSTLSLVATGPHAPAPRWLGGVQVPSWRWDGGRLIPE